MFVTLFIVTIVFSIALHEFGHFATAKAFGMKAERFFIGFGPTIWSKTVGETEYGLKGIPAGGFVKIAGMSAFEEVDPADDGRLFYQQSAWKRIIVLSAGSFTHFVLALLMLWGALAFIGLPTSTNLVAGTSYTDLDGALVTDTPAAAGGLMEGDEILTVDGVTTPDFAAVRDLVVQAQGEDLSMTVLRDGEQLDLTVVPGIHPDPERADLGFLGMRPLRVEQPFGLVDGIKIALSPSASEELTGADFSAQFMTTATIEGLGRVFSPSGLAEFFGSVGGDEPRPQESATSLVGAGQIVNELGSQGDIFAVIIVLAQLNLVLGLLNMLPLPPLDGGHVAVLGIEEAVTAARRSTSKEPRPKFRLNPAFVTPVALAVIAFFLVLTSAALYLDITQPASDLLQGG